MEEPSYSRPMLRNVVSVASNGMLQHAIFFFFFDSCDILA